MIDAMPATGGNDQVIAGIEMHGFTGFEAERGGAAKQHHPLGPLLIIPETVWTRRTIGYDVLQREGTLL